MRRLALFDLSGYTEFVARSEVAEAAGILESLWGTLLEHIEPPLVVAEVEGAETPARDLMVRTFDRLRSGRIESQCRANLEILRDRVIARCG